MIRSGMLSAMLKLGRGYTVRIMRFGKHTTAIHKRHAPFRHWYLQLIGVDPMFQGKGYGGTLLTPMLARIDREHLPCYLETQNQKNVLLYQHYGFKVVEEVIIPGTEITFWAMLRERPS